jgi:hypothetical protein
MRVEEASLPATARQQALDYGKGAFLGLALYLLLCALVFFCGFMTALGNETTWSDPILRAVEAFFVVANPLWGIPASSLLGMIFLKGR